MLVATLKVPATQEEWEYANFEIKKLYKKAHRNGKRIGPCKISRKDHANLNHSFFYVPAKLNRRGETIIPAKLFCLDREYLGVGSFGKAKLAVTQTGEVKVAKISANDRQELPTEAQEQFNKNVKRVWGRLDEEIITHVRRFNKEKDLFKKSRPDLTSQEDVKTKAKKLELMPYMGEYELRDVLPRNAHAKKQLTSIQLKILAMQTCLEMNKFHQMGEILRDAKPANFKVTFTDEPNQMILKAIDFDLVSELKAELKPVVVGKKERLKRVVADQGQAEAAGTVKYMSSEALLEGYYSTASDVYSLGVMLIEDFGFNVNKVPIIAKMLAHDPNQRPQIFEVVRDIWRTLPIEIKDAEYLQDLRGEIVRLQLLDAIRDTIEHFEKEEEFTSPTFWHHASKNDQLCLQELENIFKVATNSRKISLRNIIKMYTHLIDTYAHDDNKKGSRVLNCFAAKLLKTEIKPDARSTHHALGTILGWLEDAHQRKVKAQRQIAIAGRPIMPKPMLHPIPMATH